MASDQQGFPRKCLDDSPVSPVPTQYSVSTAPSSASTTTTARGSLSPCSPSVTEVGDDCCSPASSSYHQPDEGDEEGSRFEEEDLDDLKSDLDVYRERGANIRALELLDKTVNVNRSQGNVRPGSVGGALAAREAAMADYNRTREAKKMAIQQKYMEDREKRGKKPLDHIVAPSLDKVKLTETTRKVEPREDNDAAVEAANGIHEMKCQLDLDREAWAKRKALRLLNEGFFL